MSSAGQRNRPRVLDYLAVGHVTVDIGADGLSALGGAVSYAAATAVDLGLRAGIVTRAAAGYPPADSLPGVLRHVEPCRMSTTFENLYDGQGARSQSVRSVADPIETGHVPETWRSVGVLHVAPVAHDVAPEILGAIDAGLVGITPQGWLRHIEPGQAVTAAPWSVPDELVEAADAIVLSEEDLAADPGRLDWLVGRVPIVVMTHGSQGAVAYQAGRSLFQPALPAKPVDPTGAGDTFAAALFVRLWEGADLAAALRFAAAAAAFRVEHHGIAGLATRDSIEERGAL